MPGCGMLTMMIGISTAVSASTGIEIRAMTPAMTIIVSTLKVVRGLLITALIIEFTYAPY
jgi:hypothetical protein